VRVNSRRTKPAFQRLTAFTDARRLRRSLASGCVPWAFCRRKPHVFSRSAVIRHPPLFLWDVRKPGSIADFGSGGVARSLRTADSNSPRSTFTLFVLKTSGLRRAAIREGRVFRPVNKDDRVSGGPIRSQTV
jgi:hypothetical protein